jgi:two-component system chemotaxis response regulator CheB
MIKVLIVEDSPVAREFLTHILTSDPDIQVIGTASNGVDALETLARKRPDVITMDIHMPMMDGFEATKRIMETFPMPIVIVSGSGGGKEIPSAFRALEAGALAIVRRPPGINHEMFATASKELIRTVKLMSEVRVVKRIPGATARGPAVPSRGTTPLRKTGGILAVAIGASTGGPLVLKKILSGLPRDFRVPVFIVQHIAAGFVAGFAEWLSGASRFPVSIARQNEIPLPGHGYVAPDNYHLGLRNNCWIELSDQAPENGLRPSVSYLFRSVAGVLGPAAVGVLLTGMGADGAEELRTLKERGAVTIAQDEASSIVYGMPGAARELGAALHVLSPEGIAAMLANLAKEAS